MGKFLLQHANFMKANIIERALSMWEGGRLEGFKFFKKNFVDEKTIDLIFYMAPPINFSFLFKA